MRHSFDISVAMEFGVNAAILLDEIGHWIKVNEANKTHYHDGCYWTYNSRRAYRELFPYMSERQINTAFEKLISAGLVITGNYNQLAYDRTLWYALTQKGKSILHFDIMEYAETENGLNQKGEPIPTPNPTPDPTPNTFSNANVSTDRKKRVSKLTKSQAESFARFWETYPKKVAKENAERAWAKIDPPEHLVSEIILAVEKQKKCDRRFSDIRYIPHPATWLNGREWENTYDEGGENNGGTFKPSTGFGTDF